MDKKMLIGGKFVDSSDGAVTKNVNPYTNELIGTVPCATREDVDRAIECAVEGQKEWVRLRMDEREAIINRFLDLCDERGEEIAQILSMESGKSITECRNELKSVRSIFRAYMHAAATMHGTTLPHNVEPRNTSDFVTTIYEPLGVCVCIAPFNYPISTMTNKIAPALCAGNSVVMKPATDTPMSILVYAQLMLEAGMPQNTIQVVTGRGSSIGDWVTQNPHVAAVSLTGSTEVGVTLHRAASDRLLRVMMELGGNDPFIAFEDCNLEKAVDEAIAGRIYNAGQVCSASKRFIIQNSIREQFTDLLTDKLSKLKIGTPTDPSVVTSCCLVSQKAAEEVEAQIKRAVAAGAKCVLGGERNGAVIGPTVLTNVTPDMDIAKDEEVFGPVFPIIGFDSFDEAIDIANNTIFGLSSGIMTENMQTALKAAARIQAGTCTINGNSDYRNSYHGFGGYKMSSIGREGASVTLKEFSEVKTIVFRDAFAADC